MLRSCYYTPCRFGYDASRAGYIGWYFSAPNAPFLPYPTVYNSLNWVDRRELIDNPHYPGEVPGDARPYRKGARPAGPFSYVPCGSAGDFMGGRAIDASVPSFEALPVCCTTAPQIYSQRAENSLIVTMTYGTTPYTFPMNMQIAKNSPTWWMYGLDFAISSSVWAPQLDLFSAYVNTPPRYLSDLTLITNPTASAGNLGSPGAPYDDGSITALDGDYRPVLFSGADITVAFPINAIGCVMSDGVGGVLGYADFTSLLPYGFEFGSLLDSLLIPVTEQMIYGY